jgi:hypothetical protein
MLPDEHGSNMPRDMILAWNTTGSRSPISSCASSLIRGLIRADCSLAKTAIVLVLTKKASRMKDIIDILRNDLGGGRAKYQEGQFQELISCGMAAVKGARY